MQTGINLLSRCIATFGLLLACVPAYAQDATSEADGWSVPPPAPGLPTGFGEVMLNLLLVIVAIVAAAWIYKRFHNGTQAAGGVMKVSAVLPLGTKDRIVLMNVGGTYLVVGVSPAGLNTLHVMDESFDPGSTDGSVPTAGFAERLRNAMQTRSHG